MKPHTAGRQARYEHLNTEAAGVRTPLPARPADPLLFVDLSGAYDPEPPDAFDLLTETIDLAGLREECVSLPRLRAEVHPLVGTGASGERCNDVPTPYSRRGP